jgi:DNA-binding transcriptional LysR family regulator
MTRKIDWESRIGRQLRLRDLHVFAIVVRSGSMSKAAARLGISQPAVSQSIDALEHALRVRLIDRSHRGAEPTRYGELLLKRALVVFDELKEGIKDIEAVSDPAAGEVRLGCPESIASSILPAILHVFSRQYPRVVVRVTQVGTRTLDLPELRARNFDLIIGRLLDPAGDEDVAVEVLFNDRMVLAAGAQSRWAHRRKIELAELLDEPWILTPPGSWNDKIVREGFQSCGLPMPRMVVDTYSVHLRTKLLAMGDHVAVFPYSVLQFNADQYSLKVLPVRLPLRPWPVGMMTLKNRTLSPAVAAFADHVRRFVAKMHASDGSAPD